MLKLEHGSTVGDRAYSIGYSAHKYCMQMHTAPLAKQKQVWARQKPPKNDLDAIRTRNLSMAPFRNRSAGVECSTVEPPGLGLNQLNQEMAHC